MDIISHGLYGGIAFGRKAKYSYWKAFFFGVMPDLSSFGLLFILSALTIVSGPEFGSGPPDASKIPSFVYTLYDISHSLVVAGFVMSTVWLIRGKWMVELFAWPLHILVDIPTHSNAFFPTPFLWPLSDYEFNGVSWGHPYIFFPNVVFIILLYVWFYFSRKKQRTFDSNDIGA